MNRRSALLAASSGLLLVLCFPTVDLPFIAWMALVPLLLSLRDQEPKTGFWLGGLTGLVFFAGTVYWVTNSVHFYGGIPLLPASLITLLLCAYLALYPALFGAAVVHMSKRYPALLVLAAPFVWTALELARTFVFSGFPWALLGYSQYRLLPVIQIADITGVYGVSFLIVLVNASVAALLMDRKKFAGTIAAAAVLASVLGYGLVKLKEPPPGPGITVSVVQGNIEQDKKWDPAYQREVIAIYERLTRQALGGHPDLVIWPETATPFYFGGGGPENSALTAQLAAFAASTKTPLLFGSPTYQVIGGKTVLLRNSAFLLAGDGTAAGAYHKIHLVPFGEYVPLKSVLFFVEKMVQAIGDFVPGQDHTVMAVSHGPPGQSTATPFSVVICYEIIFPDLVRRFVDQGATVMTTITNDAWFGRTAAPYQHFSMAVLRAVENRVPVARAANTGVSGFIDARGRILDTSGTFTEALLTRKLVPGNRKTLYTQWGDWFAYLCVLGSVFFVWVKKRRA